MPMIRRIFILCASLLACAALTAVAQSPPAKKEVPLPSSKKLLLPVPGGPQRTNSFPTAIALSPDGKYLAILNNGRGTAESRFQQSIALLDLTSNQVRDFPDSRLGVNARQTYFLGLAWSSDGSELYASMASLTDPEGKSPGDTGNGTAVYRLQGGALKPQRFLKLPLVAVPKGKRFTYHVKGGAAGQAIPYPAGLAVVKVDMGDALLIAENLSDDALLLNVRTGKVARQIALMPPKIEVDPSSHPTALLLSPDERRLYVTLSNRDAVGVISTVDGQVERYLDTRLPGQIYGGSYPNALALSQDGSKLYVANASSDAVAVFDMEERAAGLKPGGTLLHIEHRHR